MKSIFLILIALIISGSIAFAKDAPPELKIRQLASAVYLHTSFKDVAGYGLVDANGLVLLDGKDAYIIDTPWSTEDTETLVHWLVARDFTIKASISTHFHEDRTAGIELLNAKSIPTYASELTNKLHKRPGRVQAKNTFHKDSFWLLKNKIEVFYPGAGHSQDNVVVWLPKEKVLAGGCFVRAKETENLGNTDDADIAAWSESAEKLKSRYENAKLVVPGHGNVGDVSLLGHTRELASVASK